MTALERRAENEVRSNAGEEELSIMLVCYEWGSSKGGISTFNRQLAVHLAKNEKLRVYCYLSVVSETDKIDASKVNVTLIKAKPITRNLDPLINLHRLPPELMSPNVIISHGRKFGVAASILKGQVSRCKWVHFVHVDCEEMGRYKVGSDEHGANIDKDSDEIDLCEDADVVVAVGPQLQKKYVKSLSHAQKNVEVFYPGLSQDFLKLRQNQKEIETKEFHVYMFGRGSLEDYELKGFDVVADAAGKLGKYYKVYSVGVPRGEEKKMEKHTVDNTAIKKRQLYMREYCNDREELKKLMCRADVVVMPSRAEAFGLIGLEALSAGVPVLVSEASGFGKTLMELTHGDTFVVESDEPEEWANRIEKLKEWGQKKRNANVASVRDEYNTIYQWDDQCEKLSKLFWNEVCSTEHQN